MSRKKKPLAGSQLEMKTDESIEEICKTCHFNVTGYCHRFPPTYSNRFSEVKANNWCGEWRAK